MRKKIDIVEYDPRWPEFFQEESERIRNCLGEVEVHHIGSSAVPGLCSKPTIDICCALEKLEESLQLEKIGYQFRGEMNIPLRNYFSNNAGEIKINMHTVEKGHGFIELNLCFRNYLREHADVRDAYARLKRELIDNPHSHEKVSGRFTGYNLGKNAFIKEVLEKAGYCGTIVNFCMHDTEWEAFHHFIDEDDPVTSFVIYSDVEIVGAAHVKDGTITALNAKKCEKELRCVVERWLLT